MRKKVFFRNAAGLPIRAIGDRVNAPGIPVRLGMRVSPQPVTRSEARVYVCLMNRMGHTRSHRSRLRRPRPVPVPGRTAHEPRRALVINFPPSCFLVWLWAAASHPASPQPMRAALRACIRLPLPNRNGPATRSERAGYLPLGFSVWAPNPSGVNHETDADRFAGMHPTLTTAIGTGQAIMRKMFWLPPCRARLSFGNSRSRRRRIATSDYPVLKLKSAMTGGYLGLGVCRVGVPSLSGVTRNRCGPRCRPCIRLSTTSIGTGHGDYAKQCFLFPRRSVAGLPTAALRAWILAR